VAVRDPEALARLFRGLHAAGVAPAAKWCAAVNAALAAQRQLAEALQGQAGDGGDELGAATEECGALLAAFGLKESGSSSGGSQGSRSELGSRAPLLMEPMQAA
jgi:hypothetical protein